MQTNSKKLILIIAIIIYYVFYKLFGLAIPCMFHKITDLYCPGCGVTRMIFSVIKLDFYQAFRYNPLVFTLGIIYILYKIISIKHKILFPKYTIYVLVVIMLAYGILRNTNLFSYLKPTIIK